MLTIGEIRKGIEKVVSPNKKAQLEKFMADTMDRFAGRIHPFDVHVASRWGRLVGQCELSGVRPPAIESMIAAIAIEHALTLVTRNTQDFQFNELAVLNPWQQ